MRPILFSLWGIPISAFGVFLLAGGGVAIAMARRRAQTGLGVDPTWTLDLSLYTILVAIVGGRLGYIVANPWEFVGAPARMLTIWSNGGLVYYGALAAGLWYLRQAVRRQQLPFRQVLDVFAAPLVLGYGIAMIGALMHGLFAGNPTGVPWAVELALAPGPRHPTAAYLLLASLGILAILRAQRDRDLPAGALFALAVLLQAFARFIADFFVDPTLSAGPVLRQALMVGPVTLGQVASAIVMGLAAVVLVRWRREEGVPEPPAEVPA
ncbi:MAG: prolipoprotein diacylglyceryl transferase [Armatimonadota bacterium]|nr:prolipoprotein diacylglyceryl transferase [Armatimonadota bacterium]